MKLAIIGTGKIVQEAFYALSFLPSLKIAAIYGRPHSLDKAETLARKHAVPEVYTDYDELLEKTEADTVYIGLVNNVHYDYARRALLAGKNVILEKPFTETLEQARALIRLAKENGLFLFEAITVLHSIVYEKMLESLSSLGTVRMALLNYSQYSSRYDAYRAGKVLPAFDPACGASSLGDLNVYNIHYAAALFGMPDEVHYFPSRGFNGMDVSGVLVLHYRGFHAVCTAAKNSDSPCFVSIQGEDGWMRIDGKPNAAPCLDVVRVQKGKPPVPDASGAMQRPVTSEHIDNHPAHRMVQEFQDFAAIVDQSDYEARDALLDETETVMRILELAKS
ncbi:MAG: Gfo/Idh/MocA family oxidoreductase [Selenomonadaceae bacterium]|nr:Gfo/Idh/MocA family oxidoreductase [Selenomonadaceae bacterium]MDY2685382.1 Gfo/Idh/MocA family oxidoreductase [Selenomonadaceae bacterium]